MNDGGPAFPVDCLNLVNGHHDGRYEVMRQYPGLSVRDYFAAAAMAAIISKFPLLDAEGEHGAETTRDANAVIYGEIANSAYWYADAMLAERAK